MAAASEVHHAPHALTAPSPLPDCSRPRHGRRQRPRQRDWRGKGLTDVQGIKVGHFTLTERPTGCTAILAQDGTTGGVDVRGGAPGTRETDLLNPANNVQIVNAITLSGGSAYGLDAAQGVMRWLEEHNIGYKVGAGRRADRAGGDPDGPRLRRRLEDPADRGLRLQGRGGGERRSGRGRQRRRRAPARRSARWARTGR